MMRRAGLVALGALVAASLAGCSASASPTASPIPLPTRAAAASGTFNEALAYQSAWHVVLKSTYVNGSVDTCDLNTPLSFQDAAALANPDPNTPVFGVVFLDGGLTYGTVWATALPGTGIESGTGTYVMSYDSTGLPATASGTATLKWHNAKKKPAVTSRTDILTLTFTKEPRSGHCE